MDDYRKEPNISYGFERLELPYIKDIKWDDAEPETILSIGHKIDDGIVRLIIRHGQNMGISLVPFEYQSNTFFYVENVERTHCEAQNLLEWLNGRYWNGHQSITDILHEIEKTSGPKMIRTKLAKLLTHLANTKAIDEETYIAPQGGRPTKRYHIKNALKTDDYY